MNLPADVTKDATLRGGEYAWPVGSIPDAVRAAARLGLACNGGKFQFRTPTATCEMYWLSVDAGERHAGEKWPAYVNRRAGQVIADFSAMLKRIDWEKEASEWIEARKIPDLDPSESLCFVADFEDESGELY